MTIRQYRAVTSGQSLGDAATIEHVWTGQCLKGKMPSAISGAFDLGNGSLVLDWLDETAQPLTADLAYEIEIRNANPGTTTLRGPLTIKPIELVRVSGTPPLMVVGSSGIFLPEGSYTFIDPGGFDAVYTATQWEDSDLLANVESSRPVNLTGGTMLEWEASSVIGTGGLPPTFAGFLPVDGGDPNIVGWVGGLAYRVIKPRQADNSFNYNVVPGDRFAVEIQPDGTVCYFVNYHGASSAPWYTSPIKLDLSVMYRLQFSNSTYEATGFTPLTYTVSIRNARWLRNMPEFTYTGDMQKADNSDVLPATVHVRVRTKSRHPLGPPSDWRYASFTRP